MLTNIFYYKFYKPYIVKDIQVAHAAKRSSNYRKLKTTVKDALENLDNATFLLNSSLKTEIISYTRDVYRNVVGAKDAAKAVVRHMEDFNRNTEKSNLNSAKKWITEDLRQFATYYNQAVDFLFSQNHSKSLQEFSSALSDFTDYNIDVLTELGIKKNNTELVFQESILTSKNQDEMNILIDKNINLFQNVYKESQKILTAPLAEHMKFKNLSYYYNYQYGSISDNTFKIIESGMIVDQLV